MIKGRKGAGLIEYAVLVVLILSGLYIMKDTISRGIFARHKTAGDSFAFGRQYDAKRTLVCKTDPRYDSTTSFITFDEDCYQTKVQGACPQCYPGDNDCYACEDAIKGGCVGACQGKN